MDLSNCYNMCQIFKKYHYSFIYKLTELNALLKLVLSYNFIYL